MSMGTWTLRGGVVPCTDKEDGSKSTISALDLLGHLYDPRGYGYTLDGYEAAHTEWALEIKQLLEYVEEPMGVIPDINIKLK